MKSDVDEKSYTCAVRVICTTNNRRKGHTGSPTVSSCGQSLLGTDNEQALYYRNTVKLVSHSSIPINVKPVGEGIRHETGILGKLGPKGVGLDTALVLVNSVLCNI